MDTLPSGRLEVGNGPDGHWAPGEEWRVEERFRLGSEQADSRELFSSIPDFELDALGRIWLIEQQDQQVRVFGPDGSDVRTIGQRGEGPGEFVNVSGLLWAPDGNLWTIDQRLGRVSIFDTAGTFLSSMRLDSFFQMMPRPGGMDDQGFFYDVRSSLGPEARNFLVRFDSLLNPIDTVLVSRKAFEPLAVMSEEVDEALQGAGWFEGELDTSRIPDTEPAIRRAFLDDEENLWVIPLLEGEYADRVAEVFNPDGVFLGSVALPVAFNTGQVVIRSNEIVAVTRDSLFVPAVVGFSIHKPGND